MYEILSMIARYLLVIVSLAVILSIIVMCKNEPKLVRKSDKLAATILILFFNIICYLLLSISKDSFDLNALIYGIASIVTIVLFNGLSSFFMSKGDNSIIKCASFLLSIGMVIQYRLDGMASFKQLLVFAISMLFFFSTFLIIIYADNLNKLYIFYGIISIALLAVTFVLGKEEYGSKNWIVIGSYSLEPMEFVKISLVLFLASVLKYNQKGIVKLFMQLLVVGACMGILVLEKDLGSALLIFLVSIFIIYIATSNIFYVLGGFSLAAAGSYFSYMFFEHVRIRVAAWQNPWSDVTNHTYQIAQSLFAISSGGWFGTGLKLGHPDLIPIAESDFVFSAICEEFGVLFGIAIIVVILIIAYRGFKIALKTENSFYGITAIGCSLILAFQSFITIGGATKFIPDTGVTLPFISYGGTSMLENMILIGLLIGISYRNEINTTKSGNRRTTKKQESGEAYG